MSTVTLHLKTDPETKQKTLIVEYESDSDMLPMEHEEAHKKLVNTLLDGGVIDKDTVIKRQASQAISEGPHEETSEERESESQGA